MTIRFLIDAQLPPGLALNLQARGFPAEHVNRIGLAEAPDRVIFDRASQSGATLITKDEDFVGLARSMPDGAAVVWLRVGNTTNRALWATLEPVMDDIVNALTQGERVIEVV